MNRISSVFLGCIVSCLCYAQIESSKMVSGPMTKESALALFGSSMRDGFRTIGNDIAQLKDTAKSKAWDVWAEAKDTVATKYTEGTHYVKAQWQTNPTKTAVVGAAIFAGVAFVCWSIWQLFQPEEPVYYTSQRSWSRMR